MLETQTQLLGTTIHQSPHLVLPAIAADIDFIKDSYTGVLLQKFPERPALVHLVSGEDETNAIRQSFFQNTPQSLHARLGALRAAGHIIAEEIHIAQPHHLVTAEHRHGHQGLDRAGADLERALRVVGVAVDGLMREAIVVPASELIIKRQRLLPHQTVIRPHDHIETCVGR